MFINNYPAKTCKGISRMVNMVKLMVFPTISRCPIVPDFVGLWFYQSGLHDAVFNKQCGSNLRQRLDSRSDPHPGNTPNLCGCVWRNGCRHSPKWSFYKGELDDSVDDGDGVGMPFSDKPWQSHMWQLVSWVKGTKTLAWTGLMCYRTAPVMDGLKVLLATFNLWKLWPQDKVQIFGETMSNPPVFIFPM